MQAVLAERIDPDGLVFAGTGAKLAVREDLRELLESDFERAIEVLHGDDVLFHDADAELQQRSKTGMGAVGQRVVRRDFLTVHRFDVRDRLGEIDAPSLAVVGEHDSLTPVRYHEHLAEELPDCELAVVDDAAHLAMLEQPERFNAAVAGFCERLRSD